MKILKTIRNKMGYFETSKSKVQNMSWTLLILTVCFRRVKIEHRRVKRSPQPYGFVKISVVHEICCHMPFINSSKSHSKNLKIINIINKL